MLILNNGQRALDEALISNLNTSNVDIKPKVNQQVNSEFLYLNTSNVDIKHN